MDNLTQLYCLMDDFCKEFEPELNKKRLSSGKRQRLRDVAPFFEHLSCALNR